MQRGEIVAAGIGPTGSGLGTLQQAYNAAATSGAEGIVLDATRLGVLIKDTAGGVGGTLLGLQSNGGTKFLDLSATGSQTITSGQTVGTPAFIMNATSSYAGGSYYYAWQHNTGNDLVKLYVGSATDRVQFDFFRPTNGAQSGQSWIHDWANSTFRITGGLVPNTDNAASIGLANGTFTRFSTGAFYTVDLKTGINYAANATVIASVPAAANTIGFTWVHTGGAGSASDSTAAGGAGGLVTIAAGAGGAGSGAQNPGAGAILTLQAGAGGTGGTGNAAGGNIDVLAGAGQGTGANGDVRIGRSSASYIRFGTAGLVTTTTSTSGAGAAWSYVALKTDHIILVTGLANNGTITLPNATTAPGQVVFVVNDSSNSSNTITVKTGGGTINGAAAGTGITLNGAATAWGRQSFVSDGTNWVNLTN